MSQEQAKTMQHLSLGEIFKTLGGSIRENKRNSIIAPVFVLGEVIIECTIPFITARLINEMSAGCGIDVIARYGAVLALLAIISLGCGTIAGIAASIASTGFARRWPSDDEKGA